MNKFFCTIILILFVATPSFLYGKKKLVSPVIKPAILSEDGGGYSVENDKVIYRGQGLTVVLKRLTVEEEAKFFAINTGKSFNVFLRKDAPRLFELYLLKIVNHSDQKVIFNPGFSQIAAKKTRVCVKDFTSIYSFFNMTSPDKFKKVEKYIQALVYDRNETLMPDQSVNKFLVFDRLPDEKIRTFVVNLSWLYIGQENLHLHFPYTVKYQKKKTND